MQVPNQFPEIPKQFTEKVNLGGRGLLNQILLLADNGENVNRSNLLLREKFSAPSKVFIMGIIINTYVSS